MFNEMVAFATSGTDAGTGTGTMGLMESLTMLIPFALILVVMYFVMIRPQKKKDKMVKEMLEGLRVGDIILTIGGIIGKIVKIKDDILTIETGNVGTPGEKTVMKVKRWSVKEIEKAVEDEEDLDV